MPRIDRAQVEHVARLARLTLRDDEVAGITADLSAIVDYVAQLAEVDVEGVPPTAQLGVERLPTRADEPRPSLARDVVFSQAPSVVGDGFAVPAFVDD